MRGVSGTLSPGSPRVPPPQPPGRAGEAHAGVLAACGVPVAEGQAREGRRVGGRPWGPEDLESTGWDHQALPGCGLLLQNTGREQEPLKPPTQPGWLPGAGQGGVEGDQGGTEQTPAVAAKGQ